MTNKGMIILWIFLMVTAVAVWTQNFRCDKSKRIQTFENVTKDEFRECINGVTVTTIKKLTIKNCTWNDLSKEDFVNCPSIIQEIFIITTPIKIIHDDTFDTIATREMFTLEIVNSELPKVPARALEGLKELEYLHLKGHTFKVIDESDFKKLPRTIIGLNLEDNNIQTIEDGAFDGFEFDYINLKGNYFVCNKQIKWLVDWLKTQNLINLDETKCSFPENLKDTLIMDLLEDNLTDFTLPSETSTSLPSTTMYLSSSSILTTLTTTSKITSSSTEPSPTSTQTSLITKATSETTTTKTTTTTTTKTPTTTTTKSPTTTTTKSPITTTTKSPTTTTTKSPTTTTTKSPITTTITNTIPSNTTAQSITTTILSTSTTPISSSIITFVSSSYVSNVNTTMNADTSTESAHNTEGSITSTGNSSFVPITEISNAQTELQMIILYGGLAFGILIVVLLIVVIIMCYYRSRKPISTNNQNLSTENTNKHPFPMANGNPNRILNGKVSTKTYGQLSNVNSRVVHDDLPRILGNGPPRSHINRYNSSNSSYNYPENWLALHENVPQVNYQNPTYTLNIFPRVKRNRLYGYEEPDPDYY